MVVVATTDHDTRGIISHMRLGHAQQTERAHNAQTHMTSIQVNNYQV